MVFRVDWATVLPLSWPIYDPGCESSYEGLIPQSRAVKAALVAANVAKSAARSAPMASGGAPVGAPNAASLFREAMGALQAGGAKGSFEVCCLPACVNF